MTLKYHDPIANEEMDFGPTTITYLVKIANDRYGIRAISRNLDSISSDPITYPARLTSYWVINKDALLANVACHRFVFPNNKLNTDGTFTLAEVASYFGIDPIQQAATEFNQVSAQANEETYRQRLRDDYASGSLIPMSAERRVRFQVSRNSIDLVDAHTIRTESGDSRAVLEIARLGTLVWEFNPDSRSRHYASEFENNFTLFFDEITQYLKGDDFNEQRLHEMIGRNTTSVILQLHNVNLFTLDNFKQLWGGSKLFNRSFFPHNADIEDCNRSIKAIIELLERFNAVSAHNITAMFRCGPHAFQLNNVLHELEDRNLLSTDVVNNLIFRDLHVNLILNLQSQILSNNIDLNLIGNSPLQQATTTSRSASSSTSTSSRVSSSGSVHTVFGGRRGEASTVASASTSSTALDHVIEVRNEDSSELREIARFGTSVWKFNGNFLEYEDNLNQFYQNITNFIGRPGSDDYAGNPGFDRQRLSEMIGENTVTAIVKLRNLRLFTYDNFKRLWGASNLESGFQQRIIVHVIAENIVNDFNNTVDILKNHQAASPNNISSALVSQGYLHTVNTMLTKLENNGYLSAQVIDDIFQNLTSEEILTRQSEINAGDFSRYTSPRPR